MAIEFFLVNRRQSETSLEYAKVGK